MQQQQLKLNPIQSALTMLDRAGQRAYMREYEKQRLKDKPYMHMREVPEDMQSRILGIWQSQNFFATAWNPGEGEANGKLMCRLTVNRRELQANGSWKDGITWDELQLVKSDCGFGNYDAVEVYPADDKLVNVANMRHLWVFKERLGFTLEGHAL